MTCATISVNVLNQFIMFNHLITPLLSVYLIKLVKQTKKQTTSESRIHIETHNL
jgi:hypothetical protein